MQKNHGNLLAERCGNPVIPKGDLKDTICPPVMVLLILQHYLVLQRPVGEHFG